MAVYADLDSTRLTESTAAFCNDTFGYRASYLTCTTNWYYVVALLPLLPPPPFPLVFYFGFAILVSFVPVDSIRLDDFSLSGSLVGRMSVESAGGGVLSM